MHLRKVEAALSPSSRLARAGLSHVERNSFDWNATSSPMDRLSMKSAMHDG